MRGWWLVVLVLPVAQAWTGNTAEVRLDGDRDAFALCQFAVLVGSVVVAGVEDSLGLVAAPALASAASPRTNATCELETRGLEITLRGAPRATPGLVLGPPPLAAAGNRALVEAQGDGHAGALCQALILVDTVIVGGGALGLAPGPATQPLALDAAAGTASARCAQTVKDVRIRMEAA